MRNRSSATARRCWRTNRHRGREAEAANRAKDVFLATLSHEMRTPLNAIVGWLSILRHEDAETRHFQEGLKVIERNTKAQVQLIDDVLDVSRIVSGKLRVDIRPCELTDVINAGVNAVRPAAEARGITLDVQLDPSASGASCDGVRIQQVVWNLVSNAVKFTPKGGRVDVTLSREQSSLQIQVSDNGQGISAELLPHVFDRFRQADSSTRRRFAGLGLGLSIVKYIVEAHGGTVEAKSPGEGKGSTFTVRLPIRAVRIGEERGDGEIAGNTGEGEPEDAAAIADSSSRWSVSTACACSSSTTKPTPGGSWSWCWNKSAPSSPRRAASAKRSRRFPRRAQTCWSATWVCRIRTAST